MVEEVQQLKYDMKVIYEPGRVRQLTNFSYICAYASTTQAAHANLNLPRVWDNLRTKLMGVPLEEFS